MLCTANHVIRRLIQVTLALTLAVAPARPARAAAADRPEVLSPKDGQQIGVEGDRLCPSAPQSCYKIVAEGRVPEGRHPFFAVEPLQVSPKMWIQPLIHRTKSDGTLSGLIYLGDEESGAGQFFNIYLLACSGQNHRDGDQVFEIPADCVASDPVKVLRMR